jgi:hypothetical protein
MEVITNSPNSPTAHEWNNLAPFYPRFNALFPAVQIPAIKYINSLAALKACSWTNEITFANIMCPDCARYIAENPAKFPQLRAIILSGHDICCDKDLVIPPGLDRLPALIILGLEYGRSCAINEPLANIREIHFNELSSELAIEVENKPSSSIRIDWVGRWFPNCQATYWH